MTTFVKRCGRHPGEGIFYKGVVRKDGKSRLEPMDVSE
jgi:hypothetical protein